MAEENLEANLDDQEVIETDGDKGAPSGALTREEFEAILAERIEAAKREATDTAFRQAQGKVDKDIARVQEQQRQQIDAIQQWYLDALAKYGAEPEELEGLRNQTQEKLHRQQEIQELQALRKYRAETEAERQRRDYIGRMCKKYGVALNDPNLDDSSPEAFMASLLDIQAKRLERQVKGKAQTDKKQNLAKLADAGALDVTGGGAAMAPPSWSVTKLVPGSDESTIAGHIMHYYGALSEADLGERIRRAQELMKNEPRLKGKLKEAARRVHDAETARE